jgi:hypothetical protein
MTRINDETHSVPDDLSSRLGIARADLIALAGDIDSHYRTWQKKNERTGKVRTLHAPSRALKHAQKRITRNILQGIGIGAEVHGK